MSSTIVVSLAVVAVLSAFTTPSLLVPHAASSHDDPIVVDNPRISVGRFNGRAPSQDGSDRRWTLHDMDEFHKLVVMTTHDGRTTTVQRPLYGHNLVRFALVADAQRAAASFSIFLAPGGQHHDKVIIEASHDALRFELDQQDAGKIADRGGALHIGEIQVGNRYLCIADAAKPQDGRCGNWQNLPDAVRVLVCANEECAISGRP
jgi:hypothetical protein